MPTIVYSKIMIDYFFCYNKAVLEAERMFTFIDKAGRNIAKRILGKIEELAKTLSQDKRLKCRAKRKRLQSKGR